MNQNCSKCDTKIEDERFHLGYKECVECSSIEPYSAHVVYPHKTGAYVQPVSQETKNNLEEIIEYSKRKEIVEINLTKQEIKFGNKIINFEIDPFKKKCLLNGSDDISLTLKKSDQISFYEENLNKTKPWVN